MATPFLYTLPKSVRAAWPYINKGVNQGLSANRIQSILSQSGLGVRRQTLLDGIRLIKKGLSSDKTIRLLKPDIIPPRSFIPDAATKIRRRYSYIFKIDSMLEGVLSTRNVTLSTNKLLNRQDAESMIQDMIETDEFKYGQSPDVITSDLVGIKKRAA